MTPPIAGSATPPGTERYASRFASGFAPDFYRVTASGLTVSSIGMGTYLGECDDREDERYTRTIVAGAGRGLNLIDTAINYRCQRSERAVGRAIRKILDTGAATRDELVVCTKAGYVPLEGSPPESREAYDGYLEKEYFSSAVMSRADMVAGGHCLRPAFISNQIERSLANLGIEHIDLFYLHNPEQQLDSVPRKDFKTLITEAFTELESQVAQGKIGAYGCATWNGFRLPAEAKNHLSLTELVEIAQKVGGRSHHFQFVQLPVNLAMPEAVRTPTQKSGSDAIAVLDLAGKLGISVMASASLMQSQLTRNLPPGIKSLFPGFVSDAQRAIAFVRSLPVSSALVGMRSLSHLEENVAAGSSVIRS